ncbi:MAG: response regulator transcription factor [candidate division NC10 bacterium]|nr:response regulator transcription factor [candidate division NC10 bacterium]MBI2454594.1 response regulator transcription factor [candidate division NC10 bacterium]MBI2563939.1 response regulator transcription factor [candidate division NC10 bacterium]MBI3121678.1 response regulator transcription factor [candidate division NC10 bacterium]
MSNPPPIRVLLVDDHALFRRGIASILAAERGFEVVGEASDGLGALERARELMPDVILMDIFMPGANGLEATRRIKEALPYVKIVMLTVSEEDQNLFEAIKSGAQGYLLKKIEPQELFAMLKGVVQGDAPISRAMAAKILGEFAHQARQTAAPSSPAANLSPREKEVLDLVTQGKSNKEIAAALAIAENTVKNHLKNILEKLHLENRVQAATYALREGLVEKPPRKSG